MPFGGAGPMHAAALADEPASTGSSAPARAAGSGAGAGCVGAPPRHGAAVTPSGDELTADRLAREVEDLRAGIAAGLQAARAEAEFDLRYRGQAFELTVPGSTTPVPEDLIEAFEAEHERRYGHRGEAADVELVNVRLALAVPGPEICPAAAAGTELGRSTRRARFADEWQDAEIMRGEPPAGLEAKGPCVFELPEAMSCCREVGTRR